MEASSSNSSSKSGLVVANERRPSGGIRIENPFTLKVGQVFTGFGIGCGVGIGVGRPINLGAIPVLNQVMGATRGATDALSGVSRHVNNSLRKLGAKNIEAGIGCGVGIGHGFGVGSILCDAGNSKARGSTSDSTTSSFGHGRCLFKDGPHSHPSNFVNDTLQR